MSTVHIRSTLALQQLKTALSQFSAESQAALRTASDEIRRTQQWLAERAAYWQNECRRAEDAVCLAAAALKRCQASASRDPKTGQIYIPDCSQYQEALRRAQAKLEAAQAELQNVQHWTRQIQASIQQSERQVRRLLWVVEQEIPKSNALLEALLWALAAYGAVSLAGSLLGSSASTAAPPQQTSNAAGDWRELGIQDVPLAQIDLSDSYVHSQDDFKKTPYDVMVAGLHKLESTVRPAVEGGANGDYFSDLDARQGLEYEHGYRRVYDAFYGAEPIRLEKINDRYQVVGGYHRLYVAQQLGLETIPANVIEQTTDEG